MSVPYIWLPLDEQAGAVANDYGLGIDWTVVDNSGTGWTDNPGFFTGNAAENIIYSDDTDVISIMNNLTGAAGGVGGKVLLVCYESINAGTAGGLFQVGERATDGWLMQRNTSGILWGQYPTFNQQSLMSTAGDYSATLHAHYAHLFDFKHGRVFNFINGRFDFPNLGSHAAILAQADESLTTVGATILGRNNAMSATPRDNVDNPSIHALRKIYIADLTTVLDPFAKVAKVVGSFVNSGTSLPADVVNAW